MRALLLPACLILVPTMSLAQAVGAHPDQAGVVRSARDGCQVMRNQTTIPLTEGSVIMPGDDVECTRPGGSVRLDLTIEGKFVEETVRHPERQRYSVPSRTGSGVVPEFLRYLSDSVRSLLVQPRGRLDRNGPAAGLMSGGPVTAPKPIVLAGRLGPERQTITPGHRTIAVGWWGGVADGRLTVRIKARPKPSPIVVAIDTWSDWRNCNVQPLELLAYSVAQCDISWVLADKSLTRGPIDYRIEVIVEGQVAIAWALEETLESPFSADTAALAKANTDGDKLVAAGWMLTSGKATWRIDALSQLMELRHLDAAQRLIHYALSED